MAKISMGVLVGQIRGKAGGGVFTKAKNGATLRIRITPSNPNTAAQSAVRSYLTSASRAYKALSSGNLADWREYALSLNVVDPVTGSSYHPSAISVFTGLASKFLQVTPDGVIPTSPPATPFSGDTITVDAAGGADSITFTGSDDNGADIVTEYLLQRLASPARVPRPNGYKSYGFSDDPDTTPFIVSGLSEGSYACAYRFVKTTTGQESGLIIIGIVTVT